MAMAMAMDAGGSASETSYIQLLDSNGNAVEVQTAYDAAMSGPIYVTTLSSNASTYTQHASTITEEGYIPLFLFVIVKHKGTMVSAIFMSPMYSSKYFYAGIDPSTLR